MPNQLCEKSYDFEKQIANDMSKMKLKSKTANVGEGDLTKDNYVTRQGEIRETDFESDSNKSLSTNSSSDTDT